MCCFLSEKALVEQAFELRSELENATSDVSNLFAKIGMWMIFSQVWNKINENILYISHFFFAIIF